METCEYEDNETYKASDLADNLDNIFILRGIHLGHSGERRATLNNEGCR